MKAYLLSATGVIFLSVIVSLIIPDGKLNKSIVFVLRMACILVLIQPVTGIFKSAPPATSNESFYDYNYISKVYSDNQSQQLEKLLLKEFDSSCACFVEIVHEEGNFKVNSVTVEIDAQNNENIEAIYEYLENLGYINITVYAKSY